MHEVEFKVHRRWAENEPQLAIQLSRIVTKSDEQGIPYTKTDGGYKWNICGHNDWKMDFNPITLIVTLAYRYADGRPGMLEGMVPFLEFMFG